MRPSVPEYFQEVFNHQDHAPYHTVGLLRMSYSQHGHIKGNFKYIGSAFLIDEDILMTAGHNLLSSEFKVPFKNGTPIVIKNTQRQGPDVMKFYRFCTKGHGEIAQVSRRQVHPYWHKNFQAGYDIGVLSLDHEFGAHQKLVIGKLPQPTFLDQDIKVLGYPAHIQRTKASTPEPNYPLSMFASHGKVIAGTDSKDPTKVYYNCLTYGGNELLSNLVYEDLSGAFLLSYFFAIIRQF